MVACWDTLAGYGRFFYKCDMARRLDCEVGDSAAKTQLVPTAFCKKGPFGGRVKQGASPCF